MLQGEQSIQAVPQLRTSSVPISVRKSNLYAMCTGRVQRVCQTFASLLRYTVCLSTHETLECYSHSAKVVKVNSNFKYNRLYGTGS